MNQRLTEAPSWHALQAHYEKVKDIQLRQLFAGDPNRGDRLVAKAAGLYLDYSKNRITDETVRLLIQLARERGVTDRRDAMFRGEKINITEGRAVLHVALRAPRGTQIKVDGVDVVPEVHAVLDKMAAFSDRVRRGEWKGHSGEEHQERNQRRYRRLVPGPRDGLRRTAHVYRPHHEVPFCGERRRRRLCRSHTRPGSRRDVIHSLLENVHNAGNHDERRNRPPVGRECAQE